MLRGSQPPSSASWHPRRLWHCFCPLGGCTSVHRPHSLKANYRDTQQQTPSSAWGQELFLSCSGQKAGAEKWLRALSVEQLLKALYGACLGKLLLKLCCPGQVRGEELVPTVIVVRPSWKLEAMAPKSPCGLRGIWGHRRGEGKHRDGKCDANQNLLEVPGRRDVGSEGLSLARGCPHLLAEGRGTGAGIQIWAVSSRGSQSSREDQMEQRRTLLGPVQEQSIQTEPSNAEGEPFLTASDGDLLRLLQSSPSTVDRGSAVLSRAHSCR